MTDAGRTWTLDELIDAKMARGAYDDAASYAAQYIDPAKHLAAMVRINKARQRKESNVFALTKQAAKLTNWNPKPELHGTDPQPAGDVTVEFNAASESILPMLDPMLRSFLFHRNGAIQHDLADETAHAPDLRWPAMPGPFEWSLTRPQATLTLHIGDLAGNDVVLPAQVKRPLTFKPMQGGTVIVTLQSRCHPDEKQAGQLYLLMGQEIAVSFDPGADLLADDE